MTDLRAGEEDLRAHRGKRDAVISETNRSFIGSIRLEISVVRTDVCRVSRDDRIRSVREITAEFDSPRSRLGAVAAPQSVLMKPAIDGRCEKKRTSADDGKIAGVEVRAERVVLPFVEVSHQARSGERSVRHPQLAPMRWLCRGEDRFAVAEV